MNWFQMKSGRLINLDWVLSVETPQGVSGYCELLSPDFAVIARLDSDEGAAVREAIVTRHCTDRVW